MGKSVYLIALIATAAIFFIVFFSLKSIEDSRFYQLNEDLRQISLENDLDKVYSEFAATDSNNYCFYLGNSIRQTTARLESLDYRLKNYKESFLSQDYVFVKKNFLITNMLLLQRTIKAAKECSLEINPIVYFYAEDKSCEVECGSIENVLEQIKQECPNTRVFAFPYNWPDYQFTSLIEKQYNVTKPGTVIIAGERFDSIQPKENWEKKLECGKQ